MQLGDGTTQSKFQALETYSFAQGGIIVATFKGTGEVAAWFADGTTGRPGSVKGFYLDDRANVPEPATIGLAAIGLAALRLRRAAAGQKA